MNGTIFDVAKLRPSIIGTGLIALDVVINEDVRASPRLWAGGTCGNVLTILSYLNWQSFPIARFGEDKAAQLVRHDLQKWGVCLDWSSLEPKGETPIFLHYIQKNAFGNPVHRFVRVCPQCGTTYPGYKPVHATVAADIATHLMVPQVFFLDRLSRGALTLAQSCANQGAIIVFEPSGIKEENLFNEAMALAHIVKYSQERLVNIDAFNRSSGPLLEIRTMGGAGLAYRSRIEKCSTNGWQHIDAYPAMMLRDSAGAGDWCTAGIIHTVGRGGIAEFCLMTPEKLYEALCFGQALAAWNCGFEGARGGMYEVSKEVLQLEIKSILDRHLEPRLASIERLLETTDGEPDSDVLQEICLTCRCSRDEM